ncbi:MAG: hypothetical protein IKM97_01145 [Clostridia bacterium]|nr:hypothetical protein [Clostridia bacterium]
MELGSVKKIVETERQAEEIINNAKEQAKKIVQKAIDSKSQKELFAKNRVEEKIKQLEERAKVDNADRIRKISETTQEECRRIVEKSSEKMQTAVNAIFKEVIS